MIHRKTSFAVLALLLTSFSASAQIPFYYTQYLGPVGQERAQLFVVQNGTDTRVPVNLPEQAFPAISNNNQVLAVTSGDPNRPNQLSQQVYLIGPNGGNGQRVTFNEDANDPVTGANTTRLPTTKAFSPNGSLIAICSIQQQTTNLQGISTVPFLDIHQTSDGFLTATPHVGQIRTGEYTELAGVDWGPTTNLIVAPVRTNTIGQDGVPVQVTSLVLMDPVTGATSSTATSTQITNPTAGSQPFFGALLRFWENDFFPVFSPSESRIAFFRTRESLDTRQAVFRQPSQVSLFTVARNGSDLQLLWNFPAGWFPTGLSWSPDGSTLIMGMADQQFVQGSPVMLAVPTTSRIFFIPSGGGQLTTTNVTNSSYPTYRPASAPGNSGLLPLLSLTPDPDSTGFIFRGTGVPATDNFRLERSRGVSWEFVQNVTGAQLATGLVIPIGDERLFLRVSLP